MDGHWTSIARTRLGRRRALAASGAAALGAAFLAACGGKDDSGTSSGGDKAQSSLAAKPVDVSKEAKKGGTIKYYHFADIQSFDPGFANLPNETIKELTSAWLVTHKPGYLQAGTNEIAPDMAESWEVSPDKLTITMKLRAGTTWHNKAPINGRPFDAGDVLASWKRVAEYNSNRTVLANSANPAAPIISVTAPDAKTISIKLKQPLSYVLDMMAYIVGGSFALVPKEIDGTYDSRRDVIGLGPYMLSNYQPSSAYTLKRHDGWWDKPYPFADQIDMPIVPEYATRLAQLQSGNLYTIADLRGDDVLPLKKQTPALNLYKGRIVSANGHVGFGWKQTAWQDERMRQALSHSFDRDGFIEAVNAVSKFEAAGLPVEARWNTAIYGSFEGDWLDPKGKDFGPNAKYFKYDQAESKKLMAAAGNSSINVTSYTPSGNSYGPDYNKQLEILENFAREVGMKVTRSELDYTSDFIPNYRNGKGQHEGWAQKIGPGFANNALGRLAYEQWSKGGDNFYGFSSSGKNDMAGDPEVDRMVEAGQAEFDNAKRRKIVQDLQRYLAQKMYLVLWPGGANVWELVWPAVSNYNVYWDFRGTELTRPIHWAIDETKAPIKKS